MMGWLGQRLDAFRGRGASAATVPPMDGALRPNTSLDTARVVLKAEQPDNLVLSNGAVLFSSGADVLRLDPSAGRSSLVRRFEAPVSCLAAGEGDLIAAGLEDGSIRVFRHSQDIVTLAVAGAKRPSCPVAMTFRNPATLIVCQGSVGNSPGHWKRDLMQRGSTGAVWQVSVPDGASRQLASGLGFPYGVVASGDDLIVTESWRHRVLRLAGTGAAVPVLADLPGYPSRIVAAASGGYWLSVFAPRSQLIEFILRERGYCERMMREIEPDHWLAPALSPPKNFLEPMQGGALRMHSILKPWAPTRSYGLLIRLDERFRPLESYHSRTDGARHGVTSCLDLGSRVLAASKGGNAILELPPGGDASI